MRSPRGPVVQEFMLQHIAFAVLTSSQNCFQARLTSTWLHEVYRAIDDRIPQRQMIRYFPKGTRYDPSVGLLFSFERSSLSDCLSLPTPLRGPPGPEKRKRQRQGMSASALTPSRMPLGNIYLGDGRCHLVLKSIVSDNTSSLLCVWFLS